MEDRGHGLEVQNLSCLKSYHIGTIHKLRRQLEGEGGSGKNLFLPMRGEGGFDKTYVGKFKPTCMFDEIFTNLFSNGFS